MIRLATPYLLGAALLLGATVWTAWTQDALEAAQAENSRLQRELRVQETLLDQRAIAASVARAEAERQRGMAEEYAAVKRALRNGDWNEELPDDFRVLLLSILRPGGR